MSKHVISFMKSQITPLLSNDEICLSVCGSARGHLTDLAKKIMGEFSLLGVIPGGMTQFNQAIDESNADRLRHEYSVNHYQPWLQQGHRKIGEIKANLAFFISNFCKNKIALLITFL